MSDAGFVENDDAVSVARALMTRARELFEEGRHDDAFAIYDEIVARFDGTHEPQDRRRVAVALLNKGWRLGQVRRDNDAIGVHEDLALRFEGAPKDGVVDILAHNALYRASALRRLGRHDEELSAYDAMVAGYGQAEDPNARRYVARALYDKATTLSDLDRTDDALRAFDELITRFGGATESGVRPRVSWGLLAKSNLLDKLERSDECAPLYDELISRHDEEIDPKLSRSIAWCLWDRQRRLQREGAAPAQLDTLDDLISRFGDASDEELVGHVVDALATKAFVLATLRRQEDELRAYDELVTRFAGSTAPKIRRVLALALDRKAAILEQDGRGGEARQLFDRALAFLDEAEPPIRDSTLVELLYDKARILSRAGGGAESLVVFDSVVSAYRDLAPDDDSRPESLRFAILALFYKAIGLARAGRSDTLPLIRSTLVETLGDVEGPSPPAPESPPRGTDEDLAAVLAEVHGGDCWFLFATADNDAGTRAVMATRALELYRRSEVWLSSAAEDWEEPQTPAAFLLRTIADGFAILSRRFLAADRTRLSVPTRPFVEWTLRLAGLDEYAAACGHPLDLREPMDAVEAIVNEQRTKALEDLGSQDDSDFGARFAAAFVAAATNYELADVLIDSPSGRAAIRTERVQQFAAWQISDAHAWARHAMARLEEAVPAAAAMVLMAQSLFVACHDDEPRRPFPTKATVRGMLHQTDAYSWLVSQEVVLPEWLSDEATDSDAP